VTQDAPDEKGRIVNPVAICALLTAMTTPVTAAR
jgi:hypothetical protein